MSKIVVYSSENCTYCEEAKKYLESKGFEYIEKNVTKDRAARSELIVKGYRGVPIIIINEIDIVGFDEDKMEQLLVWMSKGLS